MTRSLARLDTGSPGGEAGLSCARRFACPSTPQRAALILALLLLASSLAAQPLAIDRTVARWVTAETFAARVSDVALWTAIGVDVWDSAHAEHRTETLIRQGVAYGVVGLSSWGLKRLIHRRRPCAPSCGAETDDHAFPSGHTAFAVVATTSGRRMALTIPLAVLTGTGRIASKKHYATDVLAGAGLGLLVGAAIR